MLEFDNASLTHPDPPCPFCSISSSVPPLPSGIPSPSLSSPTDIQDPQQPHILLSTPSVLAFLDTAPLTRGHTLLITRKHYEKLSELSVLEGRNLGGWLTVLGRAVVGASSSVISSTSISPSTISSATPISTLEVGQETPDFNIIQNNGPRAAQVIPHVHFHIIPRGESATIRKGKESWVMFGRGQREDLDDEEAFVLTEVIRERLREELERVASLQGGVRDMLLGVEGGGGSKL